MSAQAPNTSTAPPVNCVYLQNMAALWRHDPVLAAAIDAVPDAARPTAEPTKSGDWTVAVTGPDGRKAYLHSRYNPRDEAAKLAASVETTDKYCLIVGGFGLGYHVLELRERFGEEVTIVVAEPSVALLATALAHVDLRAVLASGRLVILTTPDKGRLHDRLHAQAARMMLGTQFVPHPPSQRLDGVFHTEMRTLITDYVSYSHMSLMTLFANAEITCRNIANNLGHYVSTPPIDVLRGRFAGWPAIIVSAGPSLRKNIEQLHAARGRAVICAVQTILKPLLERGIKPDFVTSLDYHAFSGHYFEGVEGLEDIHLVAEPKVTWHVVDRYGGPVSLLGNDFAKLLIGDDLAPRDGLPAGATVAHLSLYLAQYMGCDPIIFVGQDLAYSGHVYYIPGVEMHDVWRSELNRFNTLETKEWERLVRNRPVLRKVQGNDGREVISDNLLFTYLEQFEKDIATSRAKVINATEGGARIRGTEVISLANALAEHCTRPIPQEHFEYRRTMKRFDQSRLQALRGELAARVDEVERVEAICVEMLSLLKKLQKLTHDPKKFDRTIVRVDELRGQISLARRTFRIINSASQVAELQRFSADLKLSVAKAEGADRAQRQLKRDISFVTATRDGSKKVHDILATALQRVDALIARKSTAENTV